VGTATLRVLANGKIAGSLNVDVEAAGATPRWPGAVSSYLENTNIAFDRPATITVYAHGIAPYSNARATGLVSITSNGRELGRGTLTPSLSSIQVPLVPIELGVNPLVIDYRGDANFLPMTLSSELTVTRGSATITVTADRVGTAAKVRVRLTGSLSAAPTGTIDVSATGTQAHSQAILTTAAAGVAEAEVTLPGLNASEHLLHVTYSGDVHYFAGSQNARLLEGRGRAVH
jgi:hypothetical protein